MAVISRSSVKDATVTTLPQRHGATIVIQTFLLSDETYMDTANSVSDTTQDLNLIN